MARREYHVRIGCGQPGCGEAQHFYATTRRDENEIRRGNQERPWKCFHHADPDSNLRPGNESAEAVLTAGRVSYQPDPRFSERKYLPGLFWAGPGSGSGFTSGPGFTARASDFPEGTRLIVTARIELPEESADGN